MKKIILGISLLLNTQAWALSCGTSVTFSEPGQMFVQPQLAINDQGEAVAVWVSLEKDIAEKKLFAATRNAEQKWSSEDVLHSAKVIVPTELFIDAKGNSFITWRNNEDQEEKLIELYQFAKKEKNNPWSPIVTLLTSMDNITDPKMTFDANGDVHIFGISTIEDPRSRYDKVLGGHYLHQLAQKKQTELSKDFWYTSFEVLTKNKQGQAFAFWCEKSAKTEFKVLKGAWSQDNSTWSDPVYIYQLKDDTAFYTHRSQVMNLKGDVGILWLSNDLNHSRKKVQVITCFDRHSSEPLDLAISKKDYSSLSIALNDEKYIAACWEEFDHENSKIYVVDKSPGQLWSSPIVLADSKAIEHLRMSMDPQGNILVAWFVHEKNNLMLYAAYKPVNKPWVTPVSLSDEIEDCEELNLSWNNKDHFVVAWDQEGNNVYSIHGAALSTKTEKWSYAQLSPEGKDCEEFAVAFNEKGQGIMSWITKKSSEESDIQIAELKID